MRMARIKFRELSGKSFGPLLLALSLVPFLSSLDDLHRKKWTRLTGSGSVQDFFFTRPEPGNNSPVGGDGSGGGSASGSASGTGIGRNRRVSGERDGGR